MSALLSVVVMVTITTSNPSSPWSRHTWSFHSDTTAASVDPATGDVTLNSPGETQITYQLDSESAQRFQLIYANLDVRPTATLQIESVQIDPAGGFITITDCNCSKDSTGSTPFSLRLIARKLNDITSGFASPDPQVTNTPHPK